MSTIIKNWGYKFMKKNGTRTGNLLDGFRFTYARISSTLNFQADRRLTDYYETLKFTQAYIDNHISEPDARRKFDYTEYSKCNTISF